MAYDIDIPKKYGIITPVGDTVGPGGIIRSLRTIPIYRGFAEAVKVHCPEAWVINFTNPMSICVRTLYRTFPGIRAFGCCHEVFNTQEFLASLVAKYLAVPTPSRDEIEINVKGINHFTWIDKAIWKREDLFPLIDRHMEESSREFSTEEIEPATYFVDNFQVSFELYRRFGIFPAAGDRHLVEFVPWFLNIQEPDELHRWGIKVTPSEYRLEQWRELPEVIERKMSGEEEFELFDSGEEFVDQMRALLGLGDLVTNVNLPNAGQIPDLPREAIVETNALFSGNAVRTSAAGSFPPQVAGMIARHITNQETLVDAAFSGDLDLAFRAFLNDPLITLQPERARRMFKEMVTATSEMLVDWNLDQANVMKGKI
jgi:alpha-galactosidase